MSHELDEAKLLMALRAEDYFLAEKSLSHFIKSAWPILEPGRPYLHNWHIDCIAEHLEACYIGQIKRLIINMPPRNLKSISCTVCFPVWVWLQDPTKRFFCASYAAELSTKHSVDRRDLIRSSWFQAAWSDRFYLVDDQDRKTLYKNDHRGQMFSTSVGGSGTGEGGDILILDDPQNPKMAASDKLRESANQWRDQTLSTRKNDKKTAAEIIVMQRLHEKDLTGYVLERDPDGWVQLKLEGCSEQTRAITYPISKTVKIFEAGEFLHPAREGKAEHEQMKRDLGSAGYQGQIQQDPKPQKGGFFKREWWKRYKEAPKDIIRKVQFWDTASEPGVSTDFSCCATWIETESGFYLIDLWKERVAFPELERAAKDLYAKHEPDEVRVEKKASGIQLIQVLKASTTLPVTAFQPGQKSKVVRAAGAQPTVESGNCHIPENAAWAEDFIKSHEKFPNAEHDDDVDTTSMMVEHFRRPRSMPQVRSL